jgi:hypothetical protein
MVSPQLARYHRLKTEGGKAWEAMRAKQRVARAKWRKSNPNTKKRKRPFKTVLVRRARLRARRVGMEFSIVAADLVWPAHCPVLGIGLDYTTPFGMREINNSSSPSLDRIDNSKGYIKGNVFVISWRANALKGSATLREMKAILAYMQEPPSFENWVG